MVGGEVVVPLPLLAAECFFCVDFHLLHIQMIVTQNLPGRPDKARVSHQSTEELISKVQPHCGSHDIGGPFAKVLHPTLSKEARQSIVDRSYLVRVERTRYRNEPICSKRQQLFVGEHHGISLRPN